MRKSFEKWLWEDLEEHFGLTNHISPILTEWISNDIQISNEETSRCKHLLNNLTLHYQDWNEEELKMQFIAPLISLVDYYDTSFTAFAQRNISAKLNGIELYGRVDWMLAKGKQTPRNPYVFIHEYKPEKGSANDPKGQLLSEMLAAQVINSDQRPIFGAYVTGKDWYFVVLDGRHYSVSRPYQANEFQDFEVIFKCLKEIKNILKNIIELPSGK